MNLGIYGTGMIVQDFLPSLQHITGIHLQAILSTPRSLAQAESLSKTYSIKTVFTQEEQMLKDSKIDTIWIATPNSLHYSQAKRALEAGKNVILEKPMTMTLGQTEQLIHLAKEKDLILLEAVTTRYLPNVKKIKSLLSEMGQVRIVNLNFSQYSSRYNQFLQGEVLPAFDPAKGGGALMDLNIYNINLCAFLFGKPKEVHYFANISRGIDTSGVLILEYPGFQAVCIGAKDCKAPLVSTIQAETGSILIADAPNSLNLFSYIPSNGKSGTLSLKEVSHMSNLNLKHRMIPEFESFERIIRQHDTDLADQMNEISLITMEIQTKARQSAGISFPEDN